LTGKRKEYPPDTKGRPDNLCKISRKKPVRPDSRLIGLEVRGKRKSSKKKKRAIAQ